MKRVLHGAMGILGRAAGTKQVCVYLESGGSKRCRTICDGHPLGSLAFSLGTSGPIIA